ncbi:DNA mismatch repair protein MutL, partial [Halobacteriales archaeon SW_12_71_31]
MSDQAETAIRPLDDRTVERIAAGEVVERPASAVKELVENSIDADASTVEVAVGGDGTDLLRVSDDGHGMSEADVRAAVREHTTSKIDDIDDLEAGVGTLGFRGEALHTIGAVSRTAIETKPRGATVAGTRLEYEGGEVVGVEPVGCPAGTTVEVRDLFYNTPARRKYLKREATEFAHVSRVVSRYALANPDVAVSLAHDGRETFATRGEGDLQAAIMAVYGREVAEAMVPVVGGDPPAVADDLDGLLPPATDLAVDPEPEAPVEGVTGYVSHPETTRSIPFAVLFLSTAPGSVDVNVHPRKTEVRFDDADAVRRSVREAVRAALLDHGVVRSAAPRGRSAPDETPVEPADGDDRAGDDDRPADGDGRRADTGDDGPDPRPGAGSEASGGDDVRRRRSPAVDDGGEGSETRDRDHGRAGGRS